jgi:hypothetical protein
MPLTFTRVATADDLRALVAGRRVVFLKGFGPSIDYALGLLPGLLQRLLAAELVLFDGDDFARDSFTRVLEVLCSCAAEPLPRLLAFKREEDEAHLLSSAKWTGAGADCFLPQRAALSAHYFLAAADDTDSRDLEMEADVLEQASTEGVRVHDACQEPGTAKYIRLGVRAVELVLSCAPAEVAVVALGGYAVVAGEFARGVRLFGERMPQWHYFHARRRRPGHAEWQQGLLHAVRHALLEHHVASVIECQDTAAPCAAAAAPPAIAHNSATP